MTPNNTPKELNDSARLAWLLQQFQSFSLHMDSTCEYRFLNSSLANFRGRSITEAIDKAIRAEQDYMDNIEKK